MKTGNFVHLHMHSHYSLLDGACKIEPMVKTIRDLNMPAAAITDHGNLFGAIEFYQTALNAGVKPIVGCEAYVAPRKLTDRKDVKGIRESSYHLTLLVANETGYKNLLKLSTLSFREGFYYKPRIDKDILAKYSEGLIALSGCPNSEFAHACRTDQIEKAMKAAGEFVDILGKDNFYLEIQSHGLADEKKIAEGAIQTSKALGLKLVATNDVHYVEKDDHRAHDVLLCISTGKLVSDSDRLNYKTPEFYIKSPQEMSLLFEDLPEAIANTLDVAEKCNLEINFDEMHLPQFDPPPGKSQRGYMRELCEEGLKRRYPEVAPKIRERFEYECSVIEKMGFVSYFLIVWDFIRFAKDNGIPVGPGRGSAAGSLVAFALGITDIDPLKYDLLFERFLNPSRKELPDIDIDFCQEGRQRVIDYVKQKYGTDNVSQIITFNVMKAKQAIRDVGRVMNIDLKTVDRIAKKIPQLPPVTLKEAIGKDQELADEFGREPRLADLKEFALKLEGVNRHASKHAAGIVISDKPITEYVPLYVSGEDETTQYSMKYLQKLGMLKMDFLGLENLTVIDKCVKLIKNIHGKTVAIGAIPLDDKGTFEMLARGSVKGIFQLDSSAGMRDLIQKMKPDRFEDIIATIALFRPGPLSGGMVDIYIKCKHGVEQPDYMHPTLETILKETNGVLLYQEQVMRIANSLAGLSMSDADALRKAMGKKKPELIAMYRDPFMKGCAKNRINAETARRVFDLMEVFGGYGFNKSHSAAYAMITYQTAWLKSNYPTEYMSALISCNVSKTDKIIGYLEECRQLGIEILPPDINESVSDFMPVTDASSAGNGAKKIRFGLGGIKNVGERAVESILSARGKLGKFKSIFEFCENIDSRIVDRRVLETLIKSGALDAFGNRRSQLLESLGAAISFGGIKQQMRREGQLTIFDSASVAPAEYPPLADIPEISEEQILSGEKESLGFYISSNPLIKYEGLLKAYATLSIDAAASQQDGDEVVIGGIISSLKYLMVKNGANKGGKYASFKISDLTGVIEGVMFAQNLEKNRDVLKNDLIAFVAGRLDFRREQPNIKVGAIVPVEKAREQLTASVTIALSAPGVDDSLIIRLRGILEMHPGNCPVIIEVKTMENQRVAIRTGNGLMISPSERFVQDIETLLGEGHMKFTARTLSSKNGSGFRLS